jgi:hypothetical protein
MSNIIYGCGSVLPFWNLVPFLLNISLFETNVAAKIS